MALAALIERTDEASEEEASFDQEAYPLDRYIPQGYQVHRARSKSSVKDFTGGHRACYLLIVTLHPEWKEVLERDAAMLAA